MGVAEIYPILVPLQELRFTILKLNHYYKYLNYSWKYLPGNVAFFPVFCFVGFFTL
jgi:hypothetical protein